MNAFATILLYILSLSIGISLLAHYHWFADLFSHFQIQYAVGGFILSLWLLLLRKWRHAILACLLCGLSLFQIIISYEYTKSDLSEHNDFRVMHYNRKYTLPSTPQFRDFLEESGADLIVIQEADNQHVKTARSLINLYPYQIHEPRQNSFGMVVISKHPFLEKRVKKFKRIALDNIQIRITIDPAQGKSITIYAIHPPPPMNMLFHKQRNIELEETAQNIIEDKSERIIMLGDWNISPFSPHFKNLVKNTGLKNQLSTPLPYPTWPSHFQLPLFQIPIDHILHKGDLTLISKERGHAMGSDHYPITATYALK